MNFCLKKKVTKCIDRKQPGHFLGFFFFYFLDFSFFHSVSQQIQPY